MPFAAIGSVIGGGKQASAAKDAAKTQAAAANHATDVQQGEFNTQQANIAPWLDAGKTDLGTLQSQLPTLTEGFDPTKSGLPASFSYNPADVANDPAFQFAMSQGQQALQRSAAAKGESMSGGTMKALNTFATGTADQYYNQDYNRAKDTYQQNYTNAFDTFEGNQTNAFNKLASVANVGQSANTQLGLAGENFANQAGGNILAAGNAGSAGIIGASNGINSAIGGTAAALSNMSPFGKASSNPFSSSYWTGRTPSSGATSSVVSDPFGDSLPGAPAFG